MPRKQRATGPGRANQSHARWRDTQRLRGLCVSCGGKAQRPHECCPRCRRERADKAKAHYHATRSHLTRLRAAVFADSLR